MSEERIKKILRFWFGDLPDGATFPLEKADIWYDGGPEVDQDIKDQFSEDLDNAIQGKLDAWAQTPRGSLALILILDQFSRHIFRNTPRAFEQDKKALEVSQKGINRGFDQQLYPIERSFYYMPLEHSEDLKVQEKCIDLFANLAENVPQAMEYPIRNAWAYAEQHYKIVRHFGRFPHRNKILGRASTPEEEEFLKQPGSAF